MRIGILIPILLASLVAPASAGDVIAVNYMQPASPLDTRQIFVQEIIKASLEQTVKTDGPYKMVPAQEMNYDRAEAMLEKYPNLVTRISGTILTQEHWLIIPVPINRGIVGYRIFLINRENQSLFAGINTLDDLNRQGLKAGQGRLWADVSILRANGIEVVTGSTYEGLFKMLSSDRFDFFPRGINEAFAEVEKRKKQFPDMVVETTLALYYPLPRVLATSKGNTTLADRIERGLRAIFKNGTHRKIWLKHNRAWVEMAQLPRRKIIPLKNPYALPDLPYDQKAFWFQPGENQE